MVRFIVGISGGQKRLRWERFSLGNNVICPGQTTVRQIVKDTNLSCQMAYSFFFVQNACVEKYFIQTMIYAIDVEQTFSPVSSN